MSGKTVKKKKENTEIRFNGIEKKLKIFYHSNIPHLCVEQET